MKNLTNKSPRIQKRLRKYVEDDLPLYPSEIVYYEGVEEGSKRVALRMILYGELSADKIIKYSGLSEKQLKKQLKKLIKEVDKKYS